MRPAGRSDLDSLYFTYPQFAAPTDRDGLDAAAPVVVVGGGPIGMAAALALAKEGVRCVLLERKATYNDGSRAICISRSSFYILDRLGALAPFLDKALGWTHGRTFHRGDQVLEFAMPDGPAERFRPMYNLQQQYTEAFLHQAVEAQPLIQMRWQSEVTALTETADGVVLRVQDAHGAYDLPAGWVLAADGARSPLRTMLGLRLQGENYEGRYVIADIQMPHAYPTIRRALFDPDSRPGGTVLVHRQPDDIWRIDYQLREGESETDALREEEVRRSVTAVLADIGHDGPWDLEWWSVYSANTLALDRYRHGRVIFIGDSAHIVPIFGVRGLNNGLADAHNIGWKLGRVLTGRAPERLIDSYSPERRGATLDVFANATKSTRFMTPPSRGWQLMRDAALSLAHTSPFAGQLANPRQMAPYTYADSPATEPDDGAFDGGPVAGALMADPPWGDGHLSRQMGVITLLTFGAVAGVEALADVPDLTILALPAAGPVADAFAAVEGSAYLIRPDLHIAARWRAADAATIRACLIRLSLIQGEPA